MTVSYNELSKGPVTDYRIIYSQEVEQLNDIVKRYGILQELDLMEAYKLKTDALQAFNRWSEIRHDVRMLSGKGDKAHMKDRLEDICKYLEEIHIDARIVWTRAKDSYKNHREGY